MAAAGAAWRRSRTGPAVALTVLTLASAVLTACGSANDNPYDLSDFQGGSAPTSGPEGSTAAAAGAGTVAPPPPTTTAPAGPTVSLEPAPDGAVTYTPSDVFGEGAWVERGTIAAASGVRRTVADAVWAYLSARTQLSNTWQIDDAALTTVAAGQALASARTRLAAQRAAERHTVGKFVLNLSSVQVKGDTATASGCSLDGTVEVSPKGGVLTFPAGGVTLTLQLERSGGRWRAVSFPARQPFCEPPGLTSRKLTGR